jgi:anti-anti-sigma factor
MMMTQPHFSVEDYAGVKLVKFTESAILETAAIQEMGRGLYALAEQGNKPRLVLDFSGVKILSSYMLGILLTLQGKARSNKGGLGLCGLRSELMRVFTITGLDKVFQFHSDDVEGLAAFGVPASRPAPPSRQEI